MSTPSSTPQFQAPPMWWRALALCNTLVFCLGAYSGYYHRHERIASGSPLVVKTSIEKLATAFSVSPQVGLSQFILELTYVFGTFIFCAAPALVMAAVALFKRDWLKVRSWLLCLWLVMVLGMILVLVSQMI